MAKILQLDEFWLSRLHIDWQISGTSSEDVGDHTLNAMVVPKLRSNPDDPEQFMLTLQCRFAPKNSNAEGYRIEADINGVFRLPPDVSEDESRNLLFVNGGTILFGLLRGQVAMATGSFPGGKLTLPAVHLPEVFDASIKRPARRAARGKKKT